MLAESLKTRFNDLMLTNQIKGFIRDAKKGNAVHTQMFSHHIGSFGLVVKRQQEFLDRIFYHSEYLNDKKATR